MAEKYELELHPGVDPGPLWSPEQDEWVQRDVELPVPPGGPLLLVPRAVARWRLDYDPGEYYRHYVLRFLQDYELSRPNSPLVHTILSGKRRGERSIYKKDVEKHYRRRWGGQKELVVRATREFPEILERYRGAKAGTFQLPPSYAFLAEKIGTPTPDWQALVESVLAVPTGSRNATRYHRSVEALITPLFEPSLIEPVIEHEVEEGTKRIDIRYRNLAVEGFFKWFREQFARAPWIPFECKNYAADPKNPEIAQLASRLHPRKGRLGFLVCREIQDRDRFNTRARKESEKNENYILGLDDADLKVLVTARKNNDPALFFNHLSGLLEAMLD
jgi:hypothetical protein